MEIPRRQLVKNPKLINFVVDCKATRVPQQTKQATSCLVFALVIILNLLLQLVSTIKPSNLLKTNQFRSLSPSGA